MHFPTPFFIFFLKIEFLVNGVGLQYEIKLFFLTFTNHCFYRIRKALENKTNMEDDRVAILETQLSQAKLIAEEADKKYEEVRKRIFGCLILKLIVILVSGMLNIIKIFGLKQRNSFFIPKKINL